MIISNILVSLFLIFPQACSLPRLPIIIIIIIIIVIIIYLQHLLSIVLSGGSGNRTRGSPFRGGGDSPQQWH